MPKLIIIRGNSGSGKSTLAKELQHKIGRNILVISQDIVRREMLWAKDGVNTTALPLLKNLLKYGHNNCSYVILEGILYSIGTSRYLNMPKSCSAIISLHITMIFRLMKP